jgi:hypothetical protein
LHTCTGSCSWLYNPLSMQNNMHDFDNLAIWERNGGYHWRSLTISANQRLLCPLVAMLDGWSEQSNTTWTDQRNIPTKLGPICFSDSLKYIYLYNILWSWYTSRPLATPPYSICKWYHCIHVRVVVLGYTIHYRCRTTCMISTILQYGKEMADIIANNIFHKKLLSRHVNQVGQKVAHDVITTT